MHLKVVFFLADPFQARNKLHPEFRVYTHEMPSGADDPLLAIIPRVIEFYNFSSELRAQL